MLTQREETYPSLKVLGIPQSITYEECKRFRKKGKLNQRHVGPFQVVENISPVAYRVTLPKTFGDAHDVFCVSTLRRSFWKQRSWMVNLGIIQLQPNLTYEQALTPTF